MLSQIYNAAILLPGGKWVRNGSVLIRDGIIDSIIENSDPIAGMDKAIDARGGYILPGGIDLHVHGGGGRDFMEADREAFEVAIASHRKHGTTSMLPTLASSSYDEMRKAAEICTELMKDPSSGVLGLHFEGPYFTMSMAGGQIPENIRLPEPDEYEGLIDEFPCIRRWDAAPELPGAFEFGKYLSSKGVIAGIAHTKANYPIVQKAHESGFSHATHFYNGMTTVHKEGPYRHEGTVESVLIIDDFTVEVIADGIHVPPVIMQLIYKVKGAEKMCLVTDALACTASDGGKAFDPRVIIVDGVGMLSDRSAIAGSVATMDRLIRTAVKDAGIPLEEVSRMVSETPARIIGAYDRKGSIEPGKDADLIIMTPDLELTNVFVMGRESE